MTRRMMCTATTAALAVLLFSSSAGAIVGFRGATWGDLRQEFPKEFPDNLVLQGWVKQGIDWVEWRHATLNTYVALRYRFDTEGHDWNNTIGPALGLSLDLYTAKGLSAMAGVEYIWDRYLESDRNDNKLAVYLGWYGWWDLKR
jgi:hypothetical protein